MFEVLNKLFLKGQAIRPWNIYWKIGNIHRCDFHLAVSQNIRRHSAMGGD